MRIRCTAKGYVGLLVGVLAAVFYLLFSSAGAPAAQPGGSSSPSPPPTERIDAEQAVPFPNDI
jgi:hypothetical protein